MGLSKYEMETVIRFDESDSIAIVYTYNRALKNRLKKLSVSHGEDCRVGDSDGFGGITYRIPKDWVRIRPKKTMSETSKAHLLSVGSGFRFKGQDAGGE